MRPVYVRGIGFFSPGFRDVRAWCRGDPDPDAGTPKASLLAGPLRRRASLLTRIGVDVLQQAIAGAGCDPETTVSVWGTAHGEHSMAVALLAMMRRREGKLSPTQFHNSVHNTASGYASIATANGSASTTLTGGPELVFSAFLEAWCHLEAGAGDVALVLADEPLEGPFEGREACAPLAIAFCLSARKEGALAVLSGLRRDAVAPEKRHESFGGLYVSAALPLLERIAMGRPGTIALELEGEEPVGMVGCVDTALGSG